MLNSIEVNIPAPNDDLYKFHGTLSCTEISDLKIDLDLEQFLHKGACLRNSNYIDTLVLYTGVHTKSVMN